jgi:hypothetical protein
MKTRRQSFSRRLFAALLTVSILSLLAFLTACSNTIATPSDRYAIVIGIGLYDYSATCLYSDNDAYDMSNTLASKGWNVITRLISWNSPTSNGENYTNGTPTLSAIEAAISGLATNIGTDTNATVLVYFSGHGVENSGYLVPYDGLYSDYTANMSLCISPAEMTKLMGNLRCKNKILIIDACYSGAFVDTGSSIDTSPQDAYDNGTSGSSLLSAAIPDLGNLLAESIFQNGDPSVITISAAGAQESSYSGDGSSTSILRIGNGAFTFYLLQAATLGDTNHNGYVTCTEAFNYAKSQILNVWDVLYANPPYPNGREVFLPHISGGDGDVVLFVNRS